MNVLFWFLAPTTIVLNVIYTYMYSEMLMFLNNNVISSLNILNFKE